MQAFLLSSSRVLLVVALLSPLRVSRQAAPAPQADLLTRPARIADEPLPAFSVFQGVLLVSGVPGGAAFVQGCSDQPLPMVHPHGTTLREVLDSITGRDSGYVWSMNKGVVNLRPLRGTPGLLSIRLKTYDSRDLTDAGSAVTFLSSSPEVTRAAARMGLAHNVSGSALSGIVQGPPPPQKPLGIRLHDVTLLDALNAIARANKHGVWIYSETHCGSVHQFNVSFAQ